MPWRTVQTNHSYPEAKMSTPTMQHHWGLDIEWTELHQTQEQLRPQMFTYDKLAQECIERLNEISPPPSERMRAIAQPNHPNETCWPL